MQYRRRRSDFYTNKTGNERWLVSYADFVTLLFAFFVVMYSVSQVNEQKYQVLSETLSSVFNGQVPIDATIKELVDRYPLDDKGQITGISPEINYVDTEVLATEIQETLIHMVDPSQAKILATESWVKIEVNANLLFASGNATPSSEARSIFADIAQVLAPYDNEVEVSGYTDNIPIRNQVFQSNWELSSSRASSIVRLLEQRGVASERLSAVGYGENRPVADNTTLQGRAKNRRVVLKVARTVADSDSVQQDQMAREFGLLPITQPEEPNVQEENQSQSTGTEAVIEPIRLDSGGLLFTSDPEADSEE